MRGKGTHSKVTTYAFVLLIIIIIGMGVVYLINYIRPIFIEEIEVFKPVIYLYPQETTRVNVSLSIKGGEVTISDPEYNNGWSVLANPNGSIEGGYDYLFYEAKITILENPLKGWCIQSNSLETWMDRYLIEMGLNNNEKDEFKEFWLNFLPKANYYEIKLLSKEYLNEYWSLDVDPFPDVLIRIILVFKPLQNPIILESPIITTLIRTGFSVIEWGGIILT
ncbi:MAG: hypothetical protein KGD63_13770 [Candidatus Lokiarchaeota archaeon]|nr:hypothetical protein [Candidatus Lokiarchaeota archaeon]